MADPPSVWEQQNLLDVLAGLEQPEPATEPPLLSRQRTRAPKPTQEPAAEVPAPTGTPTADGQDPSSGPPAAVLDASGEPRVGVQATAPAPGARPTSRHSEFEPSAEAAMPSLQPLPSPSPPTPAPPAVLLVLDTETTGLAPADGVCIEVGAVLFHVASRSVLSQLSFLLPCHSNPAVAVNGIAPEVTQLPQPLPEALQLFRAMAAQAEAVLAHNTAFDRQWFGLEPLPPLPQPWICSMEDIRWPEELHLRANPSVRDLALAHGVPVWAAHRALTDCLYLVHVLERCRDLEALLQAALEPRHLYRARLGYAERHLAKEAGFHWNQPVAGAWSRRLSEREAESLPFPVERLDRDNPNGREALQLSA